MIFQFLRVIGFPMGESPWRIVNPLTPKGDSFVSQLGSFARWTLHEHLLFQRRLCRKGVAVMSKQNQRVKVRCALALWFCCMLMPYWDSAPNHNRQLVASNASANTHSLFRLLGTMPQTPLNTELILWPRVLRTLLKGTLKRRPLCRDVTNRYTLMRWQYTIPSGDISFPKRGFPKWKPLTRDDSCGVLSLQKGVQISHPFTP